MLHVASWIAQIPARLAVAVLSRSSYISLYGFDIHGSSRSWFKKIHSASQSSGNTPIYGLRALPPALALADLYADPKAWHPDIDDLDIPDEAANDVLAACRLLKAELPMLIMNAIKAL